MKGSINDFLNDPQEKYIKVTIPQKIASFTVGVCIAALVVIFL